MADSDFSLIPLTGGGVSPDDGRSLNRFDNRILAGAAPAISLTETVERYSRIPKGVGLVVARSADGEIRGGILLGFPLNREECPHLLYQLFVLPEYRRQGIGQRLLAYAAVEAERTGAALLQFHSHSAAPAGEAFALRIGAHKQAVYLLCAVGLAGIDRFLLREWEEEVQTPELSLVFQEYPRLASGADGSASLFGQSCRGSLWGNSSLAAFCGNEACLAPPVLDSGFCAGLNTEIGGTFIACAELRWQAARPDRVYLTCPRLLSGYGNRELERWLLAALIGRLRDDYPQARALFTCHPAADRALAALHSEIGFLPEGEVYIWQVAREAVERYLAGRGIDVS